MGKISGKSCEVELFKEDIIEVKKKGPTVFYWYL